MAEDNKDQKTEEPTSKRITDTEDKGNFAQPGNQFIFYIISLPNGFYDDGRAKH